MENRTIRDEAYFWKFNAKIQKKYKQSELRTTKIEKSNAKNKSKCEKTF